MPIPAGTIPRDSAAVHPMFAEKRNVVPLPYRTVSIKAYDGPMTRDAIISHFLGREAYRRTEFVVLRAPGGRHAVIAVDSSDREPLFPRSCTWKSWLFPRAAHTCAILK